MFPYVQMAHTVLHNVSIASGPVIGYHWKKPGSIIFSPSFQVFVHIDKITPKASFLQVEQPQVSQSSSKETCSRPLEFMYSRSTRNARSANKPRSILWTDEDLNFCSYEIPSVKYKCIVFMISVIGKNWLEISVLW